MVAINLKKENPLHLVVTTVLSEETRQEKNLLFSVTEQSSQQTVDVRAALLGQNKLSWLIMIPFA
jgi:hypothetical protein